MAQLVDRHPQPAGDQHAAQALGHPGARECLAERGTVAPAPDGAEHVGARVRRRDGRRIQDYRCRECGRYFSAPTFTTIYWLKRPDLLPKVAALITEGAGIRQTARVLGASPSTIARMVARLGRHGMLFHHKTIQAAPVEQPLVIDGFETFEYSQFFPYHINLAVGAESWFLYHFTDSPLRRDAVENLDRRDRAGRVRGAANDEGPRHSRSPSMG